MVSVDPAPDYNRVSAARSLAGAPVDITIAPGDCGPEWQQEYVNFVLPHPAGTDILGLVFRDGSGRTLHTEKLAISDGGGGTRGGDD